MDRIRLNCKSTANNTDMLGVFGTRNVFLCRVVKWWPVLNEYTAVFVPYCENGRLFPQNRIQFSCQIQRVCGPGKDER